MLISVTNAVVNIPSFTPGQTAPVVVTFTVINTNLPVDIRLRATGVYHGVLIRLQCGVRQSPSGGTEYGEVFSSPGLFDVSKNNNERKIFAVLKSEVSDEILIARPN